MSGFEALAKKYEALAKVPGVVAQEASDRLTKLVDDEFSSGNDPYGRPWKPLKNGGRSTLTETGALRGSLKVEPRGTEIQISFSDYKIAFHQATRPILTVGVMPGPWSAAIEESFTEAMKKCRA